MDLPTFKYHPDPVRSGSVSKSDTTCKCCKKARGYIYDGPVYAEDELDSVICPWCIADGSATARYEAIFTDDQPVPEDVPADVVELVTTRTPGFRAWQQEHWLYHCADGAAFLGVVGWPELQSDPEALETLRRENAGHGWSPDQVEEYLRALDKDRSPTAYLFKCRHCDFRLAYSDSD